MDWSGIIAAVIGAGSAIAVCLINNSKAMATIETKLENLTKEVEKHNSVVERQFKTERDVDNLFHRFEELKITDDSQELKIHNVEMIATAASSKADNAHERINRSGIDCK